jgi:hypothetical protein
MSKSVSIVAMGRSCSDYLQVAGKNVGPKTDEVWAINAMGNVIRHDRVILMDDIDALIERINGYEFLKTHDKPIITSTKTKTAPTSQEYPLEEVINMLGMPYLNTTVSFAFALAMYEGFDTIHLYGCDYTYEDMHMGEKGRGNLEYLIGLATASGISVGVAASSTLMDKNVPKDRKIYGYNGRRAAVPEYNENGQWKINFKELV